MRRGGSEAAARFRRTTHNAKTKEHEIDTSHTHLIPRSTHTATANESILPTGCTVTLRAGPISDHRGASPLPTPTSQTFGRVPRELPQGAGNREDYRTVAEDKTVDARSSWSLVPLMLEGRRSAAKRAIQEWAIQG